VDPKLDIEEYLALARYMGAQIDHILETHNHADHVSGHGRLAAATGAVIHAAHLAAAVGIANLGGYLVGGMSSGHEENRPTEAIGRLDVPGPRARLDEVQVLDVRERSEWNDGHLPGSVHVPYHDLDGIPDEIDPTRPVAVICSSGQRGAVAASLLERAGAAHVIHPVDRGVLTWREHRWPVEQPDQGAPAR